MKQAYVTQRTISRQARTFLRAQLDSIREVRRVRREREVRNTLALVDALALHRVADQAKCDMARKIATLGEPMTLRFERSMEVE